MSSTFILVATSEQKTQGGSGKGWIRSFPSLDEQRHTVSEAAEQYLRSPDIRAVAVGRQKLFDRLERNAGLLDRPTMLALDRYDNALFRNLNYKTLSPDGRKRLDEQLLIFSGMWGLVRPTDRIPDYCLPMTSRMPQVGTLTSFWRPQLSATMDSVAAGSVVWDLLLARTSQTWTTGKHPTFRRRIFVRFRDANGRDISSRPASDPMRGTLARYIVEHGPTSVEALGGFSEATGWTVDRNRSFGDGLQFGLVLSAPQKRELTARWQRANSSHEPTSG